MSASTARISAFQWARSRTRVGARKNLPLVIMSLATGQRSRAHRSDAPTRGLPTLAVHLTRCGQSPLRPIPSAALRSATRFLDRPVRFATTRMLSVRTSSSSSGVQGAKLLGKRRMRDSSRRCRACSDQFVPRCDFRSASTTCCGRGFPSLELRIFSFRTGSRYLGARFTRMTFCRCGVK